MSTEQAWEDMRAYNIRLEERAREAERALAEMREALRGIDSATAGSSADLARQMKLIARAALRPEDTSDES